MLCSLPITNSFEQKLRQVCSTNGLEHSEIRWINLKKSINNHPVFYQIFIYGLILVQMIVHTHVILTIYGQYFRNDASVDAVQDFFNILTFFKFIAFVQKTVCEDQDVDYKSQRIVFSIPANQFYLFYVSKEADVVFKG